MDNQNQKVNKTGRFVDRQMWYKNIYKIFLKERGGGQLHVSPSTGFVIKAKIIVDNKNRGRTKLDTLRAINWDKIFSIF